MFDLIDGLLSRVWAGFTGRSLTCSSGGGEAVPGNSPGEQIDHQTQPRAHQNRS